jgi:hypothetical protein
MGGFSVPTFAQAIQRGTYSVAGNISYSVGNTDYSSSDDFMKSRSIENHSLSLSPSVSYFALPNFMVGLNIDYTRTKYEVEAYYNDEFFNYSYEYIKNKSLGIGPLFKYYIGDNDVKPFIGLSYLYSKVKYQQRFDTESNFSISKGATSVHSVLLSTGFGFFVSKSFAVEPFISYRIRKGADEMESSDTQSDFDGKTLQAGISFNFFVVRQR